MSAPLASGSPAIVVFGTICLDRLRRVPSLPALGGYVEVESETRNLGGEAANTAVVLRTWGNEVVLTGNGIGDDADGSFLRENLGSYGLEAKLAGGLNSPPWTPACDIYITPDGERTMFGLGFSRMEPTVTSESLPLAAGHWFTADPNMERASREAVRIAQSAGMRTYLMDFFRPDEPISSESVWQSSTDWVGHRNDDRANLEWVEAFVGKWGCFAILSDGPNGFFAGSPSHPARHFPPFPSQRVVDTTGAGDTFRAGMLHGLNQGWELPDCLRFASAAGCLSCRSLGATSAVPSQDEIERLILDNPSVAKQYG